MLFGVTIPDKREEVFEASNISEALILAHETYPEIGLRDFKIRELFREQIVTTYTMPSFPTPWYPSTPRWEWRPWDSPTYEGKIIC